LNVLKKNFLVRSFAGKEECHRINKTSTLRNLSRSFYLVVTQEVIISL